MSEPKLVHWSYARVIPQITLLLACMFCGGYLASEDAFLGACLGTGAYLVYSRGVRLLVTRHHRSGTRAFANESYEEAIQCFEESVSFFDRHAWIDRWRSLVLLTPTVPSYREMGQFNIAASLLRLGRVDECRDKLTDMQKDYPNSRLARDLLEFIHTVATCATAAQA